MPHHPWSLRWLIGGIYFCIMVVMLGGLTLYLSHQIAQNYMQTLVNTLTGQAWLGADLLANQMDRYYEVTSAASADGSTDAHNHDDARQARIDAIRRSMIVSLRSIYRHMYSTTDSQQNTAGPRRITVLRTNGDLVAETPPNTSETVSGVLDPEVSAAIMQGFGVDIRYSTKIGEELLFIAVPIQVRKPFTAMAPDDEDAAPAPRREPTLRTITRGVLVLGVPTTDVKTTIRQVQGIILLVFIGGLLVLFLINTTISSFISRPLATLSEAAEHFAHGDLHRRVQPAGAHEIASLGESFNSMATQLQSTIAHLDEQRAQAHAILASMFDGVLVTDTAGRILMVNQSLERLFDLHAPAIIGATLSEARFPDELLELLRRTIDSGLPLMHQVTFTAPIERTFEVHMAPVEVDHHHLGVVIVLYDITHQRRLEQVLRDFVANVSHELRTPVASIRAMAETLADAGSDDPQLAREFLGTMIHESERLTALLDDLLHLSRIESGRRLIVLEKTDLAEIVRHVANRVIAPVTAKGLRLVLDQPEQVPAELDRDVVMQILINLLDNARKYSPEGGCITVQVDTAPGRLRLKVTDTGIGIPPEDQERIFERFYRVDKARSRTEGGTGLGLAIVRHLAELHGGWVGVQSTPGVGSTFTVVLPQPMEEGATPEEAGELPAEVTMPVAGCDAAE